MAYKHGKNGRVAIGAANLKVTTWDGTHDIAAVEATNTESGGAQEMSSVGGIESFNGSVTAILVDGTPPPAPGQIASLTLYEGGKTSNYAYAFSAYLHNLKRQNPVKSTDPLTFTFDFMSSGTITPPTA